MFLFLPSLALAGDLLFAGGRVWDGTGAAPYTADVRVHDDRIVGVGQDLAVPEGATLYDATGATVMPGLIDAHVHLSMDPGSAWRVDGPEAHQALLEQHLRALLACGVTTILDPAILPDELVRVRSTLMPTEAFRTAWMPERLADPWLAPYVPVAELNTAQDSRSVADFELAAMRVLAPKLPLKAWAARSWFARRLADRKVGQTGAALRALRDAGVPIVMGGDSGNWPIIPFLFHGTSSIIELELLGQAGFSPSEALLTATRNAARMLGMAEEIGAVAPGFRADLIVVDGDPTSALSALRTLRWVIRDGVARSPEGWMVAPP